MTEIVCYIHCVRKKVNHCVHFHNSGKQCRISAKFCSNNAPSNCKQNVKISVKSVNACNRYSRFSEVTQKHKCHYRQPDRHVTVKVYVCANIKHSQSVFKMSSMCSNASQKTWTPLPDRFIDEQGLELFPLLITRDFSRSTSRIQLINNAPADYSKSILQSNGLRSGLLAGHRAGAMKSDVSVNSCTVSH